jgi:asparagine synthase (glutamine-hydrolysing)
MPMKNWLRGPLRPLLDELLDPRRIEARGWFDAVQVGRLVREHCAGRANHAHRLWCLMSLELSLDVLAARRQQSRPSTRPVDVVMA